LNIFRWRNEHRQSEGKQHADSPSDDVAVKTIGVQRAKNIWQALESHAGGRRTDARCAEHWDTGRGEQFALGPVRVDEAQCGDRDSGQEQDGSDCEKPLAGIGTID
jgi:hypothetical protein